MRLDDARVGGIAMKRRPDVAAGGLHEARHGAVEAAQVVAGGPWRRPVTARRDVVGALSLDGEARGAQLRRHPPCRDERAPVEGLQRHAVEQARALHALQHTARERLGIRCVVRLLRADLRLEVEPHRVSARLRELEQRVEGGYALAVDGALLRELPRIVARRIEPPDIVGRELREGERANGRSLDRQEAAARVARDVGIEARIVRDHDHVVAGHGEIGLDGRDPQRKREAKGGERVLGREAARAAMTFDVERVRAAGADRQRRRQRQRRELHAAFQCGGTVRAK